MTIKASGRAALILATGIWICAGAASQAATAADSAAATAKPNTTAAASKHGSRHLRKYAHRKSARVADKSAANTDKKAASGEESDNSAAIQSSQMPASVANANAQLPSTEAPAGNAQAMSDRANTMLQAPPGNPAGVEATADTPVVAADQLNDVDRALHEQAPAATPVALASAEEPAAAANPPAVASTGSDSSTWDQTSLIGKIFIGFGALLTMASAARMFMA
jgi:hypothetical protein